tara:strand:- start:126 stop:593 length:468 start_codon:yes stop_codon:yes gene_type:complete
MGRAVFHALILRYNGHMEKIKICNDLEKVKKRFKDQGKSSQCILKDEDLNIDYCIFFSTQANLPENIHILPCREIPSCTGDIFIIKIQNGKILDFNEELYQIMFKEFCDFKGDLDHDNDYMSSSDEELSDTEFITDFADDLDLKCGCTVSEGHCP